MTQYDYDLFTIGAGSGGVRASRMAAGYGARVAVAEEYRVGGTCVIRGCVPKKLFVYASHFAEEFEDAAAYGWQVKREGFSWSTLVANKDREIDRLNQIYIRNLTRSGVAIIEDRAVLEDAHTVRLVGQNRTVTAETILIATGAAPWKDESVPGCNHTITSNEAFHLDTLPQRIVIAGGGYIAVEFAGIFNGLGVDTTLVYRREEILRGFDDDLRAVLHVEMEKKGVRILTNSLITRIAAREKAGGTVYDLTLNTGEQMETDLVMAATGRRPNTQGLGLEAVGIETDALGAIPVDAYSQTCVPNIYAVGDVTNRANLTPVAIREGAAFAETVFNNTPTAVDHSSIPTAVFSQPELATVGLTEAEACRAHQVDIYKTHFTPMKHSLTGRDEKSFMKLVVDRHSDRILGIHLIGPGSGELIQVLATVVLMGGTKAQLDATLAVHPTSAEELVLMRERTESPVAAG